MVIPLAKYRIDPPNPPKKGGLFRALQEVYFNGKIEGISGREDCFYPQSLPSPTLGYVGMASPGRNRAHLPISA